MASINKVILVGNLGKDPEVRQIPGGQAVANFSVATTERWTDKASGEPQEKTEWHRIVVWGKQAENCGKYISKGSSVYIEGKLQTREWTDPKDETKRSVTEIIASQIQFLDSKRSSGEDSPRLSPPPASRQKTASQQGQDPHQQPNRSRMRSEPPPPVSSSYDQDDDLPF